MDRTILFVLLVFLVAMGCGGDRGPGGMGTGDSALSDGGPAVDGGASADGGASDADGIDAGDGSDTGAGDAGDADTGAPDTGPPHPGACPVGDADGCCPVALRYGGTDPDCPSFGCATATVTEPIILETPPPVDPGSPEGTAAVTWTGDDLLIAWAAIKDHGGLPIRDLWVQRRDAITGALVRGPHRRAGVTTRRFYRGGADIVWSPVAQRSFFVSYSPAESRYPGVLLDAMDEALEEAAFAGSCNGFHQPVEVIDTGTRFFATQMTERCGAPVSPALVVTPVSHGGVAEEPILQPARSRLGLSSAYDAANRRILLLWKETTGGYSDLRGRYLDVDTLDLGEPFMVTSRFGRSVDQVRAGFDGTRFGLFYSLYRAASAEGFTSYFALFDPTTGMLNDTATVDPGRNRRYAQARVAWTGDGWVVLATTVESFGASLAPGFADEPELWLYRFDAAGAALEARRIDAASLETRFPGVAFAGDTVALTWARGLPGSIRQHVLALLSCDPS